ncbi:unnamed protein product, partial [Mesorhabditis belari]|uniref:Alpha-galactosidase n=1 Tax=Mesorhabditis belari TaxID=2138241 RepID=A0AAF3FRY9_9BILA
MKTLFLLLGVIGGGFGLDNGLARTPPMGWMSWTAFYCEMDCVRNPHACINEQLYMDIADRMANDGYSAAGYKNVHVDDCWMEMTRDQTGTLIANRTRFPSGMKALAKYVSLF